MCCREHSRKWSHGGRRRRSRTSSGGICHCSDRYNRQSSGGSGGTTGTGTSFVVFIGKASRVVDWHVDVRNCHRRAKMLLRRIAVEGLGQRGWSCLVAVVFSRQIPQQIQQQPSLDVHQRFLVVFLKLSRRVAKLPDRAILDGQRRAMRLQHLVKAVHVELADKRSNVAMFEIAAEGVSKLFGRIKGKRVCLRGIGPPYQVGELRVAEHGVEFMNKSVFLHRRIGGFGEHQRHDGHLGAKREGGTGGGAEADGGAGGDD